MNREEKLEIIADILEVEVAELQDDNVLQDYETWDSVAILSIISVMDEKFGKLPHASEVAACKTIKELVEFMSV